MFKLHTITKSETIPHDFTGIAERPNSSKCWYKNGRLHRLDGPAIEYANGYGEWFIEGGEYSQEEHAKTIFDLHNTKSNTLDNKIAEIDGKKYKLILV